MTRHANQRTNVSALLGQPLFDMKGQTLGHVQEVAVSPLSDAIHVYGLVVRLVSKSRHAPHSVFPMAGLALRADGSLEALDHSVPETLTEDASYLLLERDVLDQQIIDINGHKVVRVNDVDLVWETGPEGSADLLLRIAEVEVGLRGAIRRLLKGLPDSTVHNVSERFRASVIPWNFVDLIDRDPARRVKLKVQQNKLANMHPSDLADILEELAPAERQALFISLDEEVAAEALEEVTPKMQQTLIESLDSEQVAGIVEEMDPGAAADLLSELSNERSEAILGEMDPDERQEVQELLEFSGDSAAGRMTTEYLALGQDARVSDAIDALRSYEGDAEVVNEVYLLDEAGKMVALIPLVHLLLAKPGEQLHDLPRAHIVSCHEDANGRKVAELFDKYNLRTLPVVDHGRRLIGVIHADQVIALLRAKN